MTPMWHQCNATLSHYLRRMHYELTHFVVVRQEAESFVKYIPGNMYCGNVCFVLLWCWYHKIWSRLMLLVYQYTWGLPHWHWRKTIANGPLTRYAKLWVAHAPGTFSPTPRVSDLNMHHGTCVTHLPWCMQGLPTSGFLWSQWRGKRSRHSRCMHSLQFYVSGKRPMCQWSTLSSMCNSIGSKQQQNTTNCDQCAYFLGCSVRSLRHLQTEVPRIRMPVVTTKCRWRHFCFTFDCVVQSIPETLQS